MSRPLRVLYVFTARKRGLLASAARGEDPDTLLFGFNHLAQLGIEASFHEPEYGPRGRAIARQLGRLGPDLLQLRTLPQFSRYDLVFLTGGWPLLLAAQAIPRRRRPAIVWLNMTLTNLLRRPGPLTRLLAAGIRRADHIVCVARSQQDVLAGRLGLAPGRTSLALSGTDTAFYHPARAAPPPEPPPPAVLAAGRDAGRDYATLLAAVDGLPAQARLVCSPGNLAGLAPGPAVTVRHDITPAALRDEYAAAGVVAVPTHGDGYLRGSDCSGTLVLLDALAMGKPAVISERASVHDYIGCGEHARCVPPGDVPALREALSSLLADGPQGRRMAAAGQDLVRQRYSTRHFAARLAEIFQTVTG